MKPTPTMRKKTVAGRITLQIFVVLLIVFAIMIAIISNTTKSDLIEREFQTLELLAKENANVSSNIMTTMLNKQDVIIAAIKTLEKSDPEMRVSMLAELLTAVGEGQDNILSLFFVAEPNTFIPDTPDGFSIFTTTNGSYTQNNRFAYVNESGYNSALDSKKMVILDPFNKTIDGKEYKVITVLQPILDANGNTIGTVGSNIDTEVLVGADYNNGGYKSFSNEIICAHKTVIMDSNNSENIGQPYASVSLSEDPDTILKAAENADSLSLLDTQKDGEKNYSSYVPFYLGTSATPWLSGTSISESELNQSIFSQIILMALISTGGLVILAFFCYFVARRMLRPLAHMEEATKQLSQGNLKVNIPSNSNDEMGRVASSFNDAMDIIHGYVKDIDRAMEMMAAGNFDVRPEKPFIGDFAEIENSITNFIQKICGTLNQINNASNQVSFGADQISSGATILSHGATEQSQSVQELTTTIMDLTEKVKQNHQSAILAGTRVSEAGNQVEISNSHMQNMTLAMEEIIKNSSEIEKIIKTIEDIAFQTNILALNAAVEAARAGTAGKGFAVVADEVRNLASKSAEAAKSTTTMIQNTINSVNNGSHIAQDAAESLHTVQEKAAAVVEIVDEICQTSTEQSEKIEIVAASSEQISAVIQTNSATSEENAASSEELASQAHILKQLVGQFKMNQAFIDNKNS